MPAFVLEGLGKATPSLQLANEADVFGPYTSAVQLYRMLIISELFYLQLEVRKKTNAFFSYQNHT